MTQTEVEVEIGAVDLPMTFQDKHHEALVSFWWTGTLLKQRARRFFRQCGSSEARFNLLISLKYTDTPLTQAELGRRLLLAKSNLAVLVGHAEDEGLIKRREVPEDGRSFYVELTETGWEQVNRLDELYTAEVASVMHAFTEQEQDELIRLTRKLRSAIA